MAEGIGFQNVLEICSRASNANHVNYVNNISYILVLCFLWFIVLTGTVAAQQDATAQAMYLFNVNGYADYNGVLSHSAGGSIQLNETLPVVAGNFIILFDARAGGKGLVFGCDDCHVKLTVYKEDGYGSNDWIKVAEEQVKTSTEVKDESKSVLVKQDEFVVRYKIKLVSVVKGFGANDVWEDEKYVVAVRAHDNNVNPEYLRFVKLAADRKAQYELLSHTFENLSTYMSSGRCVKDVLSSLKSDIVYIGALSLKIVWTAGTLEAPENMIAFVAFIDDVNGIKEDIEELRKAMETETAKNSIDVCWFATLIGQHSASSKSHVRMMLQKCDEELAMYNRILNSGAAPEQLRSVYIEMQDIAKNANSAVEAEEAEAVQALSSTYVTGLPSSVKPDTTHVSALLHHFYHLVQKKFDSDYHYASAMSTISYPEIELKKGIGSGAETPRSKPNLVGRIVLPTELEKDKDAQVKVVIENTGSADSSVFFSRLATLNINGKEHDITVVYDSIDAGKKIVKLISWTPENSENWFRLTVDPDDNVDESNENDNEFYYTAHAKSVSCGVKHATISPIVFGPKEKFNISVTVRNSGDLTGKCVIRVTTIEYTNATAVVIDNVTESITLVPNESDNITFELGPYRSGSYDYTVFVNEFYAWNKWFDVSELADIEVVNVTYPKNMFDGHNYTFNITLRNNGKASTGRFKLRLNINGEVYEEDTYLLEKGRKLGVRTVSFNLPVESGINIVQVDADPDNTIEEFNEHNNWLSLSVSAKSHDFYVKNITVSPGISGSNTITFTACDKNNGSADISYVVNVSDKEMAKGRVYVAPCGVASTNITLSEGRHKIRIDLDTDNSYDEDNEFNAKVKAVNIISSQPDYYIMDYEISEIPAVGSGFNITVRIGNTGMPANHTIVLWDGTELDSIILFNDTSQVTLNGFARNCYVKSLTVLIDCDTDTNSSNNAVLIPVSYLAPPNLYALINASSTTLEDTETLINVRFGMEKVGGGEPILSEMFNSTLYATVYYEEYEYETSDTTADYDSNESEGSAGTEPSPASGYMITSGPYITPGGYSSAGAGIGTEEFGITELVQPTVELTAHRKKLWDGYVQPNSVITVQWLPRDIGKYKLISDVRYADPMLLGCEFITTDNTAENEILVCSEKDSPDLAVYPSDVVKQSSLTVPSRVGQHGAGTEGWSVGVGMDSGADILTGSTAAVEAHVTVHNIGGKPARNVDISIYGDSALIKSTTVDIDECSSVDISIPSGYSNITVDIEKLDEEISWDNNKITC